MKDQKDRKGMNNKGFSFVELIIAIAILAIMAGVLAPQLIKYIDSSRKSTDVQNAQAIATAVNIALADEDAYKDAQTTATASPNYYVVSNLKSTSEGGDDFEVEVLEVLGATSGTNLAKPKYNASENKSFVIVFKSSGSSLSFEIYPHETNRTNNQLYPNVETLYTD